MQTTVYRTAGLHGYTAEFSPFNANLLAVGACQYFGIVGNGRQIVLQLQGDGQATVVRYFETNDAIFDCAWSEVNPNQLASACGDGSVRLFDLNTSDSFPILFFREFAQEVSGIDWNPINKTTFLACSHSSEVKIFDPLANSQLSIRQYREHMGAVYCARWSPHFPGVFLSCSGDGTLKLFDQNSPTSMSQLTIPACPGEVLSCDWSKYDPNTVASCGATTDPSIKLWDLRNTKHALRTMNGHRFGIRKVKFSPHDRFTMATCSYDMTVKLWNTAAPNPRQSLVRSFDHHNEFVFGLDFSLFVPGQMVSASWDEHVCIFNINGPGPNRMPVIPKDQFRALPPMK